MSRFFVEIVDQLDAEICAGDVLYKPDNMELLEENIQRWLRVIEEIKECIEEVNNEE